MEIEGKDLHYFKRYRRLYSLIIACGVFFIVAVIVFYGLALNFGLNSGKLRQNILPEGYQSYLSELASLEARVPTTELERKLIIENKKNLMFINFTGEYLWGGVVRFSCFFLFFQGFWFLYFGILGIRMSRIGDKYLSKSSPSTLIEGDTILNKGD